MDKALERAARALCELHIRNVRRHDTALSELEKMLPGSVNYAWEDFLPQARAVLQAIREPSMAMKLAGAQKITAQMPRVGPQADYDAANDSWQAMLDTALKDE